jgi:uncharacterized protein
MVPEGTLSVDPARGCGAPRSGFPGRHPNTALLMALALMYAGPMACQRTPDAGDEAAAAREAAAQAAFESGQRAWRAQRLERLLAPDGWASLVGLHWIERGTHRVGSGAANGIRLSMGPERLGLLHLEREGVRFTPQAGVGLGLDGAPLRGATALRTDAHADGPSVLEFDDGRGQAMVIERGGRHALRVKHADAPSRTGFAGLEYWPGGRHWQVDARFEPHPPGRTIPIASIIGTLEDMANPGAVVFERDGAEYRIEALDDGSQELFLIFADRTSGHGSYPAGRYLYTPRPGADGRMTVDFNRAYNPPCAFTAFATCPLPPPENRLDLSIEAGEKAYGKPAS